MSQAPDRVAASAPGSAASRAWGGALAARRLLMPALAAACYAVALVQRPGREVTDSRIELSADPLLFLHRVAALWSPTSDLGHVHAGQSVGYLLPMGPWYALGHLLGAPTWITQRLWLGTLLTLCAWGAVRLVDALYDRRRALGHLVAGAAYAFNPYTVMFTNRATASLLAYAILPWLLLAVRHGLRDARSWRAPAAIGLLLALSGGGTNATFTVAAMAGPLAFAVYEWLVLGRPRRDVAAFAWRAALCAGIASCWWVVPLMVAGASTHDFLSFTEQPQQIWSTTSMPEALRLLGYWPMYLRIAFQRAEPLVAFADDYLLNPAVVGAGFALAALAGGGLWWTRRWAYGPFFALLWVGALVAMTAGYPDGTPLHGLLMHAYYEIGPLQILRTTYKAAPLAAMALAMLLGVASDILLRRARAGRLRPAGRRVAPWALLPLATLPLLVALPLVTGQAINRDWAYGRIPAAWRAALGDAQDATTANQRIAVLPGELFGAYDWGSTNFPVAPALVRRAVLTRSIVRYADPRSTQLQASVDDLVQHVSLVPGQLAPLLRLLGVGQVVVAADGDRARNWSLDPVGVARALSEQGELARAGEEYGPRRRHGPEQGRTGPVLTLPQLRRVALGGATGPGIVRRHPRAGATVLDGDGDGVTELAATGALRPARALFYAGDLDRLRLRELVARGAALVFSDSNRRRPIASARLTEAYGPTLGPDDPTDPSWPHYDPFPARGADGRTVAVFGGLRWLRAGPAPLSPPVLPEHRPFAALDGRPDTAWLTDATTPSRRWIELALARPRLVRAIEVHPHVDAVGATQTLGISVNSGPERDVGLHRGANRVAVGPAPLRTLRLRIKGVASFFGGIGGIDELRVPGLRVREALRLPRDLAELARGLDLSRTRLSVVLRRTTADDPYLAGADVGDAQAHNRLDMVDAEPGLNRIVTLPAGGVFAVRGWASAGPAARDHNLDALAGLRGGWRFDSSGRFEGLPARRASSAFDGTRARAWVGDLLPGRTPWLAWHSPRPVRVDRLRIVPGAPEYAAPRRVRLSTPGGLRLTVVLPADGLVRLPRPIRTRAMRLEVLGVRPPTGLAGARLLRAVSVAEVVVPGLRVPVIRRRGPLRARCGALRIRGASGFADLSVRGDVARLDAGRPLRLAGCGRASRLTLRAGANTLDAPPGAVMRPDHLRLDAGPPPARDAEPAPVAVRADATGTPVEARLSGREPGWLVLGESYDAGWRARCDAAGGRGRDLGRPLPIDGFANGWLAPAGCSRVRFAFAPQRAATAGYAVSAVGLAAMIAILLAGLRGRSAARKGQSMLAVDDPMRRASIGVGLAGAAAVAVVAGAVFALRMGAVLGLAAVALTWAGVSVRRLLMFACAGLGVVAALYLAVPSRFVSEHLDAHWVAVAVVWGLGAAAALAAGAIRRAVRERGFPP